MEELKQARMSRLMRQMEASGWKPDPEGIASNPVKLWLYSVSLENGPRLVTQVGAQLYRDMQSGGGLIADLAARIPVPGDALSDALHAYDTQQAQDEQSNQALAMYLAFYAAGTRSWSLVKPLSEVEGAHFFVFDWQAKDGKTTVLRPAHHHQTGPMREDEIAALFSYVLQAHLRLHPADAPKES